MNKKEILHKIINGQLSVDEQQELLNSSPTIDRMKEQWNKATEMSYANSVDGDKALKKITHKIGRKSNLKILRYYKLYSAVASVLLIFMLGSMLWLYPKAMQQPDEMYVMLCGRQTVDSITLPDGTRVQISSGSRLTYPKEFKGDFRRVQLLGQAFFEVTPNKDKPFIVETGQMEVMALGTAFEVFSFGKDTDAETVLLDGKVKVTMTESAGQNSTEYILRPNQKLSLAKEGLVKVEEVNANTYSAWRNKGRLSFENEKLAMIMPRLERWYQKKIICDKQVANTYRFSFTINEESCADVLRMLCKTAPLIYEEHENAFILKKK